MFLSPQQLIARMPPPADKTQGAGGCLGGDPADVGPFLGAHGGVYQAKNLSSLKGCHAMGQPALQNNFTKYYTEEWGRINATDPAANAQQMVAEIGARGPISGSICVTPEFEAYTGGIFEDTTGCTSLDHSISIAGYGTDAATGKDYWVIRNSWGTYWGERGGRAWSAARTTSGSRSRRSGRRRSSMTSASSADKSIVDGHGSETA